MESGYVRYYKDPGLHPKRQYIGVALEKDHSLPYPLNGARRRRLNMVAGPADQPMLLGEGVDAAPAEQAVVLAPTAPGRAGGRILTMGHGYAYREANWQIGRAAERAGVQVKPFVPGDRWAAWRKSQARIQANEEKKRLRNSSKKGGSKKAGKKAR
jgi:large subunit ribosomal protein L27